MTREYYEINEDAARQAKAMWSHSDYVMGSKTEEYKKAVDEAYDLVDKIRDQNKLKKRRILLEDMQRSWQIIITRDSELS